MVSKIGIDAGGTLIKVAYEEMANFRFKTYTLMEAQQLMQWLQFLAPKATLYVTGGRARYIESLVQNKVIHIEEFKAITEGARYLVNDEKYKQDEFTLVSIGTGTSIFYVSEMSYERLVGSGIGGGTLMGLGGLITGETDFQTLVDLASKGDSCHSDLLVRDIYAPNVPPINGNLTASNFGKAHLSTNITKENYMASLVNMIGETITLLAFQAASSKQIKKIVFLGSTLNGNAPLRNTLARSRNILPYEPIFLEKGSYAGAIGTLLI